MTEFLGFFAYLLLPLIGISVWRLEGVRRLSLDGRLAVAGAAGALIVALAMASMSVAGLQWSRTRLFMIFGILAFAGAAERRIWTLGTRTPRQRAAIAGMLVIFGVTTYGLLTARETCGDLLFFWGPKAVHFFQAGRIDLDYLFDWNNSLGHRDYPPLLPLIYAWSHTVSRQFAWWGAVLFSGLCLAGIVAIVRAGSRSDIAALLTAATLACAFASAPVAGAAEPLLLLFEATGVGALLFIDDPRSQWIVASIGVAGAVLTKVEGASFAVAVVIAVLLVKPRTFVRVTVVVPAAVFLAAWLFVMARHGMLAEYRGSGPLYLGHFGGVVKSTFREASYNAFWIPWFAPLIVVFAGGFRRARLPLAIGVLTFGATIFYYLHGTVDPTPFWIPTSAPRVLLTPLLMLLMAAAAAISERSSAPARATDPACR